MAKTWARLIERGKKSFTDVPDEFKDEVMQILIEDGYIEYTADMINAMKSAELKEIASQYGISTSLTVRELKEALIELFRL